MILESIQKAVAAKRKLLAILIDPDKFDPTTTKQLFSDLPEFTSHILVGGSTVAIGRTEECISFIKEISDLPIVLFPGDYSQIAEEADALLFLSLLSGRNPEYLIEQQIKAVTQLKGSTLEVIPTGYLLIDGGKQSAVQRISKTIPIPQTDLEQIVNTALAGQFMGKKLIYLEAGSGATFPVNPEVISGVKRGY